MNRISNHIISILLAVVFLVGCDKSGEQLTVSNDGSDRIILDFSRFELTDWEITF